MPKLESAKDVLIRVRACGVCGTDMHIFDGDEGAAATPRGTVLGHEFAGEVVAVGEGVTSVKAGDRVCVDPNRLCGTCDFCRDGIGHFLPTIPEKCGFHLHFNIRCDIIELKEIKTKRV